MYFCVFCKSSLGFCKRIPQHYSICFVELVPCEIQALLSPMFRSLRSMLPCQLCRQYLVCNDFPQELRLPIIVCSLFVFWFLYVCFLAGSSCNCLLKWFCSLWSEREFWPCVGHSIWHAGSIHNSQCLLALLIPDRGKTNQRNTMDSDWSKIHWCGSPGGMVEWN